MGVKRATFSSSSVMWHPGNCFCFSEPSLVLCVSLSLSCASVLGHNFSLSHKITQLVPRTASELPRASLQGVACAKSIPCVICVVVLTVPKVGYHIPILQVNAVLVSEQEHLLRLPVDCTQSSSCGPQQHQVTPYCFSSWSA